MDGKTVLLFVAVIAVGMFVLPSTLALYTGQHDFVNGSNVDCGKCHSASTGIGAELYNVSGSPHSNSSEFTCKSCHASVTAGANVSSNNSVGYDANTAHAASVGINCIGCHSLTTNTTLTSDGYVNVSKELESESSAHKMLNFSSSGTGGIDDKDLICVACHTKVGVIALNISSPEAGNITIYGGNGTGTWMY